MIMLDDRLPAAEENGRRHFMTRRFDRVDGDEKLHMQSLAALAHFDYKQPGAYGYEQAFLVMRQLGLSEPQSSSSSAGWCSTSSRATRTTTSRTSRS